MNVETFLRLEEQAAARGFKLRPYQREGARWLNSKDRAALFDSPRLGKTMQELMALEPNAPVLICCPSGATLNWRKHARNWRPDFHVTILEGERGWRWPRPGEIAICNFEILPPAVRELDRLRHGAIEDDDRSRRLLHRRSVVRRRMTLPYPGTQLVCDEVHRLRNPKALCTLRWRELVAMALAHKGRVHVLSGSPLYTKRDNLYTVANAAALAKEAFGTPAQYKSLWLADGAVATALKKVALRRERSQVMPDLPPKTREAYLVQPDPDTQKLCDDLAARLRAVGITASSMSLERLSRAQTDMTLSKHIAIVRAAIARVKIPALLQIVEDAEAEDEPLVVFSSHRDPIDLLAKRRDWSRISGDEGAAEKHRIAEAFQAGRGRGVACSTPSAGEAIDLWRSPHAVFVDLPWTWAAVDQAEDRIVPQSNKIHANLLFTRLTLDHWVERRVEELIRERQEDHERSVMAAAT